MLEAHRLALISSAKHDGALIFSAPRLSEFPPVQEHHVPSSALMTSILEQDLSEDMVHAGRVLHLTTIVEPAMFSSTITVVTEDDTGSAVLLVVHYFTTEHSLMNLHQQLPQGTRVSVREPYFQLFPSAGHAVCCAQPLNLEFSLQGVQAPLQGASLPENEQFSHTLNDELMVESYGDQVNQFHRAEALVGMGRYREAVRALLVLKTPESREKVAQVLQRVRECEKGEYDFLALHTADTDGPTRFPCASYFSPRIAVKGVTGCGKGVIAEAVLSAGELIMAGKAEHIIFNSEIVGRNIVRVPGWDDDGEDCMASTLLMQGLARATHSDADRRKSLLELSRGRSEASTDDDEAELLRLLQLVQANRFTTFGPWDGASTGTGIWLAPSRLNHACNANCSWCTIGDLIFVRCQREVQTGEELTIAYCNPTDSFDLRQEFLWKHHNFTCGCRLCNAQRGDAPRADIYGHILSKALACEAKEVQDYQKALNFRTKAFEFLRSSDYCSMRQEQADHATAASAACCKLKRPEDARSWLQSAKQAFALQWGCHSGVWELYAQDRA